MEENWFGVVMNTGRFIHRKGYRRLWEDMLVLSPQEIPLELFLSVTDSADQAREMHYAFNASIQRRASG